LRLAIASSFVLKDVFMSPTQLGATVNNSPPLANQASGMHSLMKLINKIGQCEGSKDNTVLSCVNLRQGRRTQKKGRPEPKSSDELTNKRKITD